MFCFWLAAQFLDLLFVDPLTTSILVHSRKHHVGKTPSQSILHPELLPPSSPYARAGQVPARFLPTSSRGPRTLRCQGMGQAGGGTAGTAPHPDQPPSSFLADPPKQVLLKLQPAWVAAGRPFTVECHVPAVKPLESLTLTLLHGKEALCNKTFTGEKNGTRGATVTHNGTAHREDSRHNFSCHAHLDLRSRGGSILHGVSEPQMLKVYGEECPPGGRGGRGHSPSGT